MTLGGLVKPAIGHQNDKARGPPTSIRRFARNFLAAQYGTRNFNGKTQGTSLPVFHCVYFVVNILTHSHGGCTSPAILLNRRQLHDRSVDAQEPSARVILMMPDLGNLLESSDFQRTLSCAYRLHSQ